MAAVRRSWSWPLAVAALIVGVGAAQSLVAQEAASGGTGSIAGRLTDLHSMPVEGAVVVLRNETTGAEMRSTTLKNGIYSFTGLDSGTYAVEAESELRGRGRLEHIFVTAGNETRVQTAMEFEASSSPSPSEPVQAFIHEIVPVVPEVHSVDKTPPVVTLVIQPENKKLSVETPAVHTAEKSQPIGPAAAKAPLPAQSLQRQAVSASSLPDHVQQAPMATAVQKAGTAQEGAGKPVTSSEIGGKSPSGAKALPDSGGLARGLKPPPPSVLSSSGLSSFAVPQTTPCVAVQAASPNASQAASQTSSPNASQAASHAASKPKVGGAALISAVPGQNQIGPARGRDRNLAIDEATAAVVQVAAHSRPALLRPLQAASKKVDPVTPVVTTTVSGAELRALPASGRRWQDFELDTPAAATAAGGRAQASLRGAGQSPAEASIDGASIRRAFGGQGGYGPGSSGPGSNGHGGREQNGMGQAWSGGRGAQVAEAAIREVEMAAGNAEAEGLRTAGGRVNVETQGGGNGLHGQVFFFDRQNSWGAQNPFTQWLKETTPANGTTFPVPVFTPQSYTPPDHETVWGLGLGSQIRRNKLFWFGALDSYRRNNPGLATVKHPTLCADPPACDVQTGFFAQPTNDQMQVLSARLGLSSSNPIAEGLTAYSTMMETLGGLLGPAPRTASQWVGFGRIDWQAAERHHFTMEGIGADWNSPGGGLTRVSETYGTNSFGTSQASEEWVLGRWEAFITPNLLAVTQGSLGRTLMSAHAETPSAYEQTLLAGNTWGQLPQINVDSRYGFTIGNPSRFGTGSYPDERATEAQETLD